MGRLLAISLRPSARTPVRVVAAAQALAGRGLEGDHRCGAKAGSRRQVTLLAREAWEAACAELGTSLDPSLRRANLLVEGLDLEGLRGRRLRIGPVLLEVAGETRPCGLMDDIHPGLWEALKPAWRGGVFARILEGGPLAPGDPVALVDPVDDDRNDRDDRGVGGGGGYQGTSAPV